MLTTDERHTATIPAPPSRPRLRLQPDLSARTLLDGGWWPRSADPAAELPGLILAIEERHGPITRIMLGRAGWDASLAAACRRPGGQPRRAARLVRNHARRVAHRDRQGLGGPTCSPSRRTAANRPPGPPWTRPPRPGNRTRTPALLAAITTAAIPGRPPAATPAGTTPDSIQLSTWEWEGGQDGTRSQRAAKSAAI